IRRVSQFEKRVQAVIVGKDLSILLNDFHAFCEQQRWTVVGENIRGRQLRDVAGIIARFERFEASGYKNGESSRPIRVNPVETLSRVSELMLRRTRVMNEQFDYRIV